MNRKKPAPSDPVAVSVPGATAALKAMITPTNPGGNPDTLVTSPKYQAKKKGKPDHLIPGPRPTKTTQAQKELYLKMRTDGVSQAQACRHVHIVRNTGQRWDREWEKETGTDVTGRPSGYPRKWGELRPPTRRATIDFEYFQRRYLGRIAVPWQEEMAEMCTNLEATPRDEYVVVNLAPGSGKSSTLVAIVCWMIVRKREIRILWGSYSQTQAEWYTRQIRDILQTTVPIKAKPNDLKMGTAVDADATIAEDFGRMRPEETGVWRNDQFTVEQFPGRIGTNKEATVQAFGMDTSFIGGRYDLVVWDDVYDAKKLASWESKEKQRKWWIDTAETRLDMGGLLLLQMQRLDPEDISAFAKGLSAGDEDEIGETEPDTDDNGEPVAKDYACKYRHIIYPAHFEDRCKDDHGADAKPYPEGCLLYPKNLPWRKIQQAQQNNPNFRLIYQQEDVDAASVLVEKVWISGGTDREGVMTPGCWDNDRSAGDMPRHVNLADCTHFVTVDPSPSNWWAIQEWLYHGTESTLYMIDLVRAKMGAPEFLDFRYGENRFTGILPEWVARAHESGLRISHVVLEVNAAQKFMAQYDHAQRFGRLNSIGFIPHTTNQNKSDSKLGIHTLAPEFRFGRIRLPGAQDGHSRLASLHLINEVTRYQVNKMERKGGLQTDDQVMACWFARLAITKLYRVRKDPITQWRPSWVRSDEPQKRIFGVAG